MKKVIFLFLAVAILMTGCANKVDYKYADNWKPDDVKITRYECNDEFYAHAEDINTDVTPIKEMLSEYFKGKDFDWDNFAKVKTMKNVTVKTEEIQDLSEDFLMMLNSYSAMYDDDTKEIYLFPFFFEGDTDAQLHALVHELIHALVSTGHENYTRLEEGLVDCYTCSFMEALGWTPQPVYLGEIIAINWLNSVFGEEEVLRATKNGEIGALVDQATKSGMEKKLSDAMIMVHNGFSFTDEEITEAVNVEFDILSHVAQSQKKGDEANYWLQYANAAYGSIGINMDTKYFEDLLERSV